MKIIKKALPVILGIPVGLFLLTQIIYWLNLDNKVIFRVVYPFLQKHYNSMERDRKF